MKPDFHQPEILQLQPHHCKSHTQPKMARSKSDKRPTEVSSDGSEWVPTQTQTQTQFQCDDFSDELPDSMDLEVDMHDDQDNREVPNSATTSEDPSLLLKGSMYQHGCRGRACRSGQWWSEVILVVTGQQLAFGSASQCAI